MNLSDWIETKMIKNLDTLSLNNLQGKPCLLYQRENLDEVTLEIGTLQWDADILCWYWDVQNDQQYDLTERFTHFCQIVVPL